MRAGLRMTPEQLLGEFAEQWVAGQRPEVEEYLLRTEADDQSELRRLIEAFVVDAPRPEYSDETLDEIGRQPTVQQLVASLSGESGLWPSVLPRLRREAKLTRDQVVARLIEQLELPTTATRKTKRYLHGMETGTLEPQGVSGRVLDSLAAVLRTTREELELAGDFRGVGRAPAAPAYFRADTGDLAASAMPADEHAEWDEVDRLFRGGPGE